MLLSCLSAQAEVTIETFFEPSRVRLNEKARYIIRLQESDTANVPKLEPIEDLALKENMGGLRLADGRLRRGASRQISINGDQTFSDSFDVVIDVTPPRTGNFTIPAHSFTYKGERYTAPAASLTVVESTASEHPSNENKVRLMVEAPETLYTGQTSKITVKLYIYSGLDYVQYSQLNSSAPDFVFKADDGKAFESREYIQGWEYQVVNWPVEITPIKSGELTLDFEVIVSQTTGFGFFSRNRERFPVYSEPTVIEVVSLPKEGQPESFTGAIGDFSIEVFADQDAATQGEPIMMSLTVRGRGNFERISGPVFAETDAWKHYNPETFFEPSAEGPYSGSKRFDYVFIPKTSGELALPEVAFSYFDASSEKYVELTSPPIPIKVSANNAPSFIASPSQTGVAPQLDLKRTLTSEEALFMLDYIPQPARSTRPTLLETPLFYAANAALSCALIAGAVMTVRKRKRMQQPAYQRAQAASAALKPALRELASAVSANDSPRCYKEVQHVLRLALTKKTGKAFTAAGLADFKEALTEAKTPADVIDELCELFARANQALYSNDSAHDSLNADAAKVQSLIKALES
ncbi:MAG: BatD family protein [Verrucomicrobiota bacterium]